MHLRDLVVVTEKKTLKTREGNIEKVLKNTCEIINLTDTTLNRVGPLDVGACCGQNHGVFLIRQKSQTSEVLGPPNDWGPVRFPKMLKYWVRSMIVPFFQNCWA